MKTTTTIRSNGCCAPYCFNSPYGGSKKVGIYGKILSFHKFPQQSTRLFDRWAGFCQYKVPPNPILCSDHFESKDVAMENIVNDKVIRVFWPHAVPTIQARNDKVPVACVVRGCDFSKAANVTKHLFQFPKPSYHKNGDNKLERLRQQRRSTWINLLGMVGVPDNVIDTWAICSAHFVSGRPSHTSNLTSPDWKPSLHMSAPRAVKLPFKLRDSKTKQTAIRKSTQTIVKSPESVPQTLPVQTQTTIKRPFPQPMAALPLPMAPSLPFVLKPLIGTEPTVPKVYLTLSPVTPTNRLAAPINRLPAAPNRRVPLTIKRLPPPSARRLQSAVAFAQLASLRESTNLKELFINGELDHTQMGRTVKIDRVIDGVQQSFVLKLLEPPQIPDAEEILGGSADSTHATNGMPTSSLSRPCKVVRIGQPSSRKRIVRLIRKMIKKRKEWNYRDHLVRRLSSRTTKIGKKQSFKKLILSYRTLQKKALKNTKNIIECIVID